MGEKETEAIRAIAGTILPPLKPVSSQETRTCEKCGAIIQAIPHPLKPGAFCLPPKCQCEIDAFEREEAARKAKEAQERIDRFYGIFRMPDRFLDRRIENFEPDEGSKKAHSSMQRFISSLPERLDQGSGAWFMGPNGNGKTHLAASVYHETRKAGESAVFVVVADLLKRLQATFADDSPFTEWQLTDPLFRARLVVLDDLGQEKPSDWAREKIFTVINHRYENRKSTIVTTNQDPEILAERLGNATIDRLTGMCRVFEITSPSRRWSESQDW